MDPQQLVIWQGPMPRIRAFRRGHRVSQRDTACGRALILPTAGERRSGYGDQPSRSKSGKMGPNAMADRRSRSGYQRALVGVGVEHLKAVFAGLTFTSRRLGLTSEGTNLPVFTPVAASKRWTP